MGKNITQIVEMKGSSFSTGTILIFIGVIYTGTMIIGFCASSKQNIIFIFRMLMEENLPLSLMLLIIMAILAVVGPIILGIILLVWQKIVKLSGKKTNGRNNKDYLK
jgi:hypothetical protein